MLSISIPVHMPDSSVEHMHVVAHGGLNETPNVVHRRGKTVTERGFQRRHSASSTDSHNEQGHHLGSFNRIDRA